MSATSYTKKTISRDNFISHTVGHLNAITRCGIGGFPRMLINLSLLEFGGRALMAEKDESPNEKKDFLFEKKDFLFKMLTYVSTKTKKPNNYDTEDVKRKLYEGFRHGLAHILIPTHQFTIGNVNHNQHLVLERNNLHIDDKKFSSDLKNAFEQFLQEQETDKSEIPILVEQHESDREDLNYYTVNQI